MKRFFCAILAVLLVITAVVPAFAATSDETIMPRYSYIEGLSASLSIGSLGLSACSASCVAFGGDSIKLTATLQQYNGSTWSAVKTWSATTTSTTTVLNKNYAVYKGYTYRVRATCSVYNANGTLVESGYIYSNQVVY